MRLKLALALVLVRNRPSNAATTHDYIQLLRAHFTRSYECNTRRIELLESLLHDARREIFYLKHGPALPSAQLQDVLRAPPPPPSSNLVLGESRFVHAQRQLNLNLEFICHIVKLKNLDARFTLNESTNETILNSLTMIFKQLHTLLFDNDDHDHDHYHDEQSTTTPLPDESLLHCFQLFVNIYDIEWLYYLRDRLLKLIGELVLTLIKRLLDVDRELTFTSFDSPQSQLVASSGQLHVYAQILVVLSTSDYLVNSVLLAMLDGLSESVHVLLEAAKATKALMFVQPQAQAQPMMLPTHISDVFLQRYKHLIAAVETIVRMRSLSNFAPLSVQLKKQLHSLINDIFLNLTDFYPNVAIQLAKVIQLLALDFK